jgi:tripartite-type tricarboxylate transporter receptor subunit TctC
MFSRRQTLFQLASAAAYCGIPAVYAQDASPIKLLVGATGGMDFTARLIAEKLKEKIGRPVVVMPKLGAGQRVALGELQHSAPDGKTIMLVTSSLFSLYPHIFSKLDYDPIKDFTPIAGVSTFDVGIATGPATGAKNMAELVRWIKTNPKQAIYGSAPGTGSLAHFAGISMALAIDASMTHVPYKDSSVGLLDTSTGRLPMMMTGLSSMIELHKAGKIRILASSGNTRSPLLPEVPTMMQSGVKVESSSNAGIFGPAHLPAELVRPLTAALMEIASTPEFREKLAPFSVFPKPLIPQELMKVIDAEHKQFAVLVKSSGYTAE